MTAPRSSVRLRRHALAAGGYLAQFTLNRPASLNALTADMAAFLLRALREVAGDREAAGVWLDGAGEYAFCTGGDLRKLRQLALAGGGARVPEAERFFEDVARVIHLLHHYPKPVLCWGHGLLMGDGIGLFNAASHRIATAGSCLAMPEVAIGLCPSPGSSWLLHRMPRRTGLFAALTGVPLSAGDALYTGLADYVFDDARREQVWEALLLHRWQFDAIADSESLGDLLTDLEAEQAGALPSSALRECGGKLERLCGGATIEAVARAILGYRGANTWLQLAGEGLRQGSACSARLIFHQWQRSGRLSLADSLRDELALCANRVRDPEFAEGVRARLIDRDHHPQWAFRSVADVPEAVVEAHYLLPWSRHPLADLQ